MGFLDGLFNPSKNTKKGYKRLLNSYGTAQKDFNQARSLTDPFFQEMLTGGRQAYGTLADLVGINGQGAQNGAINDWQMSPAFQSTLDRGQRTIEQGAAARGTLMSGDAINASREYGQDLQNREFDTQLGRLASLVGHGQQGAGGLTSNSNQFGNLQIGKGQAYVDRGRAIDAGNQAAAGNVLGIAGTIAGAAAGMPINLGGGFGQNGRFNGSYNRYTQPYNPYTNTGLYGGLGGLY